MPEEANDSRSIKELPFGDCFPGRQLFGYLKVEEVMQEFVRILVMGDWGSFNEKCLLFIET